MCRFPFIHPWIALAGALAACATDRLPPAAPPDTAIARPLFPPPTMPDTPLGAPSNVDAVAVDTLQIEVTWTDKSSAESGFRVERAAGADGGWSTVATTAPNVEHITEYGLPSEHRYCYRIIAFNASVESEPSPPDCLVPPAAPTDLVATAVAGSAIDFTWKSHSPSATGYRIMRAVSSSALSPLATVSVTSYHDTDVQYGKSYMYSVHAVSNDGSSGTSNVVTIALARTPPAPVTNVTAFAASFSVGISWQDHRRDESGSRVERSTDDGNSWMPVTSVLADYTDAADIDSKIVNPEHRYCYRVLQFNSSGDGPPSEVACTTTIAPPTDLAATLIAGDSIAFSWTDNSQIERGYQIIVQSQVGEGWLADLPANSQSAHLPMQPVFTNPRNVFYVVAYTDTGMSDGSNGIQFGTASGRILPHPTTLPSRMRLALVRDTTR